jgi:hypothetical protein
MAGHLRESAAAKSIRAKRSPTAEVRTQLVSVAKAYRVSLFFAGGWPPGFAVGDIAGADLSVVSISESGSAPSSIARK